MYKRLVVDLRSVNNADVPRVGGKNASLGELIQSLSSKGIRVPSGFATTSEAYWHFLDSSCLRSDLVSILNDIDPNLPKSIDVAGALARRAVLSHELPSDLHWEISNFYDILCAECGFEPSLAVRSSATAEDLPDVSFAGQHESFLNVCGREELLVAVHHCYASLFTARAIDYRIRNGFDHMKVALSVGVQRMVRSDMGSAGVIFTLDTESGFRDVVLLSGSYGLGETVVQGSVNPDEWTVFKPTLASGHVPIIDRRIGSKARKLVFEANSGGTHIVEVDPAQRIQFCLNDADVIQLAKWACVIESHYSERAGHLQPMDIEWAKDGLTGEIFILQARPETAHSDLQRAQAETYVLTGAHGEALVLGQAVGERIACGPVKVVLDPSGFQKVNPGDVPAAKSPDQTQAADNVGGLKAEKVLTESKNLSKVGK